MPTGIEPSRNTFRKNFFRKPIDVLCNCLAVSARENQRGVGQVEAGRFPQNLRSKFTAFCQSHSTFLVLRCRGDKGGKVRLFRLSGFSRGLGRPEKSEFVRSFLPVLGEGFLDRVHCIPHTPCAGMAYGLCPNIASKLVSNRVKHALVHGSLPRKNRRQPGPRHRAAENSRYARLTVPLGESVTAAPTNPQPAGGPGSAGIARQFPLKAGLRTPPQGDKLDTYRLTRSS